MDINDLANSEAVKKFYETYRSEFQALFNTVNFGAQNLRDPWMFLFSGMMISYAFILSKKDYLLAIKLTQIIFNFVQENKLNE